MNTPNNDGGPAFPAFSEDHGNIPTWSGMSLRDWFAGIALQGMLAHDGEKEVRLFRAYEIAEAMIAERNLRP